MNTIIADFSFAALRESIVAIAEKKTSFQIETVTHTLMGEDRHVALSWSVAPGHETTYGKVLLSMVDITDRKLAEDAIKRLAYHDSLTGLPNRLNFNARLVEALTQAKQRSEKLAMMMLDLDRFKEINDTLGHRVGDELLRLVAIRLKNVIRKTDVVARMGGDEFLVLLPRLGRESDSMEIAEKIVALFKQPFMINDQKLHITTSVGVVIFPYDGNDSETLTRNADIAMYQAKARGRNTYQRYSPSRISNFNGFGNGNMQ